MRNRDFWLSLRLNRVCVNYTYTHNSNNKTFKYTTYGI